MLTGKVVVRVSYGVMAETTGKPCQRMGKEFGFCRGSEKIPPRRQLC